MSQKLVSLPKIDSGTLAYYWFGRPLLISNCTLNFSSQEELFNLIDAECANGCDGFAFRFQAAGSETLQEQEIAFCDEVLRLYSQKSFVRIELNNVGSERSVLNLLQKHIFPFGYIIASKHPKTLANLYRLEHKANLSIALIVDTEEDFVGLNHCPYSSVEITDALTTQETIHNIHNSCKEVFVKVVVDQISRMDSDRRLDEIGKRINWLVHEEVDAIICDDTALVAQIMSLSTRIT
jgi:hypothetical protein